MPENLPVTTYIFDSSETVFLLIKAILEELACFEIVGHSRDETTAVAQALSLSPQAVLIESRLPDLDGVAVCRQIKKEAPQLKVLLMTGDDEDRDIKSVMAASRADGYCKRRSVGTDLVKSLQLIGLTGPGEGKPLEERYLARRAVSIAEENFGDDHAYVALFQMFLGDTLKEMGKLEESEQAYGRAVAMYEELGPEHELFLALALRSLAGVLCSQGRRSESAGHRQRALILMADHH